MVVLTAYFTIEFSLYLGLQLWVYSVNRNRLSTQLHATYFNNTRAEIGQVHIPGDLCENGKLQNLNFDTTVLEQTGICYWGTMRAWDAGRSPPGCSHEGVVQA